MKRIVIVLVVLVGLLVGADFGAATFAVQSVSISLAIGNSFHSHSRHWYGQTIQSIDLLTNHDPSIALTYPLKSMDHTVYEI